MEGRRRGRRRIRALSPPPPGGSSGCAARGSRRGAPRGSCGGAGPAAGLSPGGGGGGGGQQWRQLPPLSSGPLRSAPWCVDSSPSCCLMESRRSRHRKCLYCPPHSLPVAGTQSAVRTQRMERPFWQWTELPVTGEGFMEARLDVHRMSHEDTKKAVVYVPEEGAYHEQNCPIPWYWTFSLQTHEKINFCCLSHPICGILLWQPGSTNTIVNIKPMKEKKKGVIGLTFFITWSRGN